MKEIFDRIRQCRSAQADGANENGISSPDPPILEYGGDHVQQNISKQTQSY